MAKVKAGMPVQNLVQMEFAEVDCLDGRMKLALGDIEDTFGVCIHGESGSGKTTFTGELLAQLSALGKIDYESFEEGATKSFKKMVVRAGGAAAFKNGMMIYNGTPYEEMCIRLDKKGSAKILVIDSWQYTGWTLKQYQELKERYLFGKTPGKRKIIILISHAEGKQPEGRVAKKIRYDVMVKIFVKGYIAFVSGRYENTHNYVIWDEGAKGYWGTEFRDQLKKVKDNKKKSKPKKPTPAKLKQGHPSLPGGEFGELSE